MMYCICLDAYNNKLTAVVILGWEVISTCKNIFILYVCVSLCMTVRVWGVGGWGGWLGLLVKSREWICIFTLLLHQMLMMDPLYPFYTLTYFETPYCFNAYQKPKSITYSNNMIDFRAKS